MAGKNKARQDPSDTKARLVAAGARLFGRHGFEATSTRALAAGAGVNLAAIPYHFGGKEGLYRAVLEHITAVKVEELGPLAREAARVCADPEAGTGEVLKAMRALVRRTVAVMLGSPESRDFSQIMVQEQIAPTAAFDVLYQGFFSRMHQLWAGLLARLTGLARDSLELNLRTLSVMGQLVIFRVGMRNVVRSLGCEEFSDAHLECVAALIIDQIEAIVADFHPVCPEGKG